MIPIQELLSRIRWDAEFGAARFEIGFFDRVKGDMVRLPLAELWFDPQDHFDFRFCDANGEQHTVPLHRIKSVYRNGRLIWHREH
jgi:uncharacterized protein (UPF0248 family)